MCTINGHTGPFCATLEKNPRFVVDNPNFVMHFSINSTCTASKAVFADGGYLGAFRKTNHEAEFV